MKRVLKILLFIYIFIVGFNVNAETYDVKQLIPVNTNATVETELFKYDGMVYDSSLDSKGYSHLKFSGITNLSTKKEYVSINVLLYDENQVNIGFLTYCTEQDLSSDNNRRKIASNETISFDITVSKRYFPLDNDKENGPSKVKYISVLDANEYCRVGGYNKYLGKKHDEIIGSNINIKDDPNNQLYIFLQQDGMKTIVLSLIICLVLLFIQGIILNILHSKMFIDSTLLAYIPLGNNYVAVKCAFGPKIAKIFVIILIASIPLSFVFIGLILAGICSFVSGIAFLLVLVKIITKKYDLFYYDPELKSYNDSLKIEKSTPVTENNTSNNNEESLENDGSANDQVVDLNFGDDGFSYSDSAPDPNVLNDNDSFELPVSGGASSGVSGPENTNTNNNNQDGESDLTKFFS